MTYEAVSDQAAEAGYVYGAAPVVRAHLVFDVYMARDIYSPLMPAEIVAWLDAE